MSEPLLPDTTSDERPEGWGDEGYGDADDTADDERLRAERPPHYDRD